MSQVVTAWEKLPAPLKAAILAIIKTVEAMQRDPDVVLMHAEVVRLRKTGKN